MLKYEKHFLNALFLTLLGIVVYRVVSRKVAIFIFILSAFLWKRALLGGTDLGGDFDGILNADSHSTGAVPLKP